MKTDLVETVRFCFTGSLIAQLSSLVDETEPGVQKALGKSVPLVLNGLLSRVERGFSPDTLLDTVREADAAQVLKQLSDLRRSNWHERGTDLLLDLLGDSYRSTVTRIAAEAGIRPTASGTLLQVAATAVLGVLGKSAVENNFTPAEFIAWLSAQKDAIGSALLRAAIETALRPGAGPGPASLIETERRVLRTPAPALAPPAPSAGLSTTRAFPAAPAPAGSPGMRWQWGALLLAAVCLGYFFGRGFIGPSPQAAGSPAATALVNGTPAGAAAAPAGTLPDNRPAPGRYYQDRDTYVYDTGRPIVLKLADGTTERVGANSTENRLYTFLASAVQVDSVNRTKGWINMDRVNFNPSKATLTPGSAMQLVNIARILKTFPRAVVKVGGYTDSTGSAPSNYQLSDQRARATMLVLVSLGVSPDRIQSKGYGPRFFVVPNTTPTGRAQNRRVSIRVVQK